MEMEHLKDNYSSLKWHLVAVDIATQSPLKFGWVEDGRFIDRIGNLILVEFPKSAQDMRETVFFPNAVKKIEEQLTKAMGVKIALKCLFTGREVEALESKQFDVTIGGIEGLPDNALFCPICGCEWTHLEVTKYISGEDNYKAHPEVRGGVIKIGGWCEDGCGFDVFLGQHKGTTHVWAEESIRNSRLVEMNPADKKYQKTETK